KNSWKTLGQRAGYNPQKLPWNNDQRYILYLQALLVLLAVLLMLGTQNTRYNHLFWPSIEAAHFQCGQLDLYSCHHCHRHKYPGVSWDFPWLHYPQHVEKAPDFYVIPSPDLLIFLRHVAAPLEDHHTAILYQGTYQLPFP